jgi:outer membrane lipoprotein-sorting protein
VRRHFQSTNTAHIYKLPSRVALEGFVSRLIFALCVLLLPFGAAAAEPAGGDAQTRADLKRAEAYLNTIDTMQSRFVQVTSRGGYSEGVVILDRPGQVRFDYDPPNPALLVANGLQLLYYDRELEQATYLPLWETPLWFLLREHISLSDKVEVLAAEREPGALRVRLRERDAPERGTLELQFADNPLQLHRWEVTDAQGVTTRVALIDPQFGVPVSAKAFDVSHLPGVGLGKNGQHK